MEAKQITLIEVLEDAVRTLASLPIPVAYIESITAPIHRVCGNLQSAINALKEKEAGEKNGNVEAEERTDD
jgi:hypothetical protein